VSDLEVVQSEIRRLNLLVEQFVQFAGPRPPRFPRHRLEEALLLIGPEAAKKSIRLERSLPKTAPVWAEGDQLKQVFVNLLLNAVQAMDAGGRWHASTDRAVGGVVVRIRDTGPAWLAKSSTGCSSRSSRRGWAARGSGCRFSTASSRATAV
jgi:signal transduction histidine kinase